MSIRDYIIEALVHGTRTTRDNGHAHKATIDSAGNGKTTSTSGSSPAHAHEISEKSVTEVNEHTHKLSIGNNIRSITYGGRPSALTNKNKNIQPNGNSKR